MKESYYWVPWFRELSKQIAEFADGRQKEFLEKAKQIDWDDGGKVVKHINQYQEDFDPFSFIYIVANKHAAKGREKVFRSISEVFELRKILNNSEIEYIAKNDQVFPIPPPFKLLFLGENPDERNPDTLWRLLKSAVEGISEISSQDFSNALKIPNVGIPKLTQALCLVNATEYLPVDSGAVSLKLDKFDKVPPKQEFSLETYEGL